MNSKTLRIENPCEQPLLPDPDGEPTYYCSSCQKHVHDLSDLSESEILAFFERTEGPVCAQLRKSQLDRVLRADSKKTPPPLHNFEVAKSPPLVNLDSEEAYSEYVFKGLVVDAVDRSPIAYAVIDLLGTDAYTITDEEGQFILPLPAERIASFRIGLFHEEYKEKRVTIKNHPLEQTKTFRLSQGDYRLAGEVLYSPRD